MIDVKKIPIGTLEAIRGNLGCDEDDPSKDDHIANMDPLDACRAAVAWFLGDPAWYGLIMAIHDGIYGAVKEKV